MVQFITLGHSVFDPHSDRAVNYIYHLMTQGPLLWITESETDIQCVTWCYNLYPRRLLLHKHFEPGDTMRQGIVYTASSKNINNTSPNTIILSCGMLIPDTLPCALAVYWVDDNREQNRACYRTYQQRGIKPNTIHLDAGNV